MNDLQAQHAPMLLYEAKQKFNEAIRTWHSVINVG